MRGRRSPDDVGPTRYGAAAGSPVVPQDPPSWVARAFAWLVLAAALSAGVAAFVVRVPTSVECAFVLVAASEPDAVRAPLAGVLEAVQVRAGEEVAEGAALFVVRPPPGRGEPVAVRSPYRGVVLSIAPRAPGQALDSEAELARLVRADAPMKARLRLAPSQVALVARGQRVRLAFEALPPERYGSVAATLEWVSAAAVASDEGPAFHGLATLDEGAIGVDGERRALRLGMTGRARIVVARPTIAQRLLGRDADGGDATGR